MSDEETRGTVSESQQTAGQQLAAAGAEGHDGYAVWTVLARGGEADGREPLADAVTALEGEGIVLRGVYDVTGFRADADLIVWLHGEDPIALQAAMRRVRRTNELAGLDAVWSAVGVHRDAEFNKSHVPGFLRGERARTWLALYPFNRSYEWYLLPAEERSRMLAEHGRRGAAYREVVANTVSAFALGDYEWILPLEFDDLTQLVDMMRDLRAVDARMHVRDEVPFFTGRRIELDEIGEVVA